jgi:hypothetical protein
MLVSALRSSVLALVTASALGGVGQSSAGAAVFTNLSLPTVAGQAVESQTLTEAHATWSSPPAAYAYQWQRCNSAGEDCSSIPKAREQTYRLTAEDVGFRIRVGESARDAEGAVTPSVSEPTAVVQAQAAGEHGGGGGAPVSCCDRPTHVDSAAALEALLARQLVPSGKSASISALLKHGGLRASFKFPVTGALLVKWYLAPLGAKSKLLATGRATLAADKTVAVSIRLTAAGRARSEDHARRDGRIHTKGRNDG